MHLSTRSAQHVEHPSAIYDLLLHSRVLQSHVVLHEAHVPMDGFDGETRQDHPWLARNHNEIGIALFVVPDVRHLRSQLQNHNAILESEIPLESMFLV